MYHSLFIHSPLEEHLGYFRFLEVMNKAATNNCIQVFVWTLSFHFSSGKYLRVWDCIVIWEVDINLYKTLSNCFPQRLQHFTFSSAMYKGSTLNVDSSTSSPTLVNTCYFFLYIIAILTGVKWYLIVVMICVPLMTRDIEHLLICLLAICISYVESCLFETLAHFCFLVFLTI